MGSMMLCKKSNDALKLNESLTDKGAYVLEGVVAELGIMNANHRIYTEEEYLKHLQYLRDDIRKGVPLLGELDHPEDRFEVKLKEASHRMLDLWYEPTTHTVKCRLELLNTPNGLLAKSIVDQGIPLHISSRAAGTINKDNTVSIQQIYTYDLVAKPGFPKAVLHRVNESVSTNYTKGILDFLKRAEELDNKNIANVYGMVNESVFVGEAKINTKLRKEALAILDSTEKNTININDMATRINENDAALPQSQDDMDNAAEKAGVPTADMSLAVTEKEDDENKETEKEDTKKDTDKSEYEILDVEAVFDDESEKETEKEKDASDEDTEDKEDKEDKKTDDKDSSDDTADKADESAEDENAPKATKDNMLLDKKSEVVSKRDGFRKSIDELVSQLKKKKEVNEALRNELSTLYPFTVYMDEPNLNSFAELDDKQKSKVVSYLAESLICDPVGINEKWKNGINDSRNDEPIWLKYANREQRELFESASQLEKDNLKETAKYLVFENKNDIEAFWQNSGLKTTVERRVLNESYIRSLPVVNKEVKSTVLPYTVKEIEMITDMACEYNNR